MRISRKDKIIETESRPVVAWAGSSSDCTQANGVMEVFENWFMLVVELLFKFTHQTVYSLWVKCTAHKLLFDKAV